MKMNIRSGRFFVMAAVLGLLVSITIGTMIKMNQGGNADGAFTPKAVAGKTAGGANVWVEAKDYKDWRFECRGLEGKENRNCTMFQNIAWDNTNKRAMTVAVNYVPVKNKEGKLLAVPRMSIIAPLGIRLPYGAVAKLKNGKEHKMQFSHCLPIGCVIEVGFGGEFLEQMKGGGRMAITFMRADGKPGNVSVSLDGFSESFTVLTEKAREEANG